MIETLWNRYKAENFITRGRVLLIAFAGVMVLASAVQEVSRQLSDIPPWGVLMLLSGSGLYLMLLNKMRENAIDRA